MNEIGELLQPEVVVLLVGERPGLATAESLSAYMAYRPRNRHSDAHRNLISNIHSRGVSIQAATKRIVNLADEMMRAQNSGVQLKEQLPGAKLPSADSQLLGDQ
jgi:ethanolamine ammonia-lyase small subunit